MRVVNFKYIEDESKILEVHPLLLSIFFDLSYECFRKFKKILTLTSTVSTIEQDNKLKRRSASHRQKRAIDISVRNLNEMEINYLVNFINNKPEFINYHYLANSGDYRLALRHGKGDDDHIHMAIHSRYSNEFSVKLATK